MGGEKMQDKEMPLGTAIPVAAQRKILHKQYTRNLARIKDYYCKLYVFTVLTLCLIALIGFCTGCILSMLFC
ncbi:MAG: hypothetical protein HFE60_09055 [Anaerotignum sp.]|nr:hypothetical protein [Anaerotignum sp.]